MLGLVTYRLREGDTLQGIAAQQLGDARRWSELVALNRLRFPYLSDDPLAQLGPVLAQTTLQTALLAGSIALGMGYAIGTDEVPLALLVPRTALSLQLPQTLAGGVLSEVVSIKACYATTTNEVIDSTTFRQWPADTVRFVTTPVGSPAVAPATTVVVRGALPARSYSIVWTYQSVAGGGAVDGTLGPGETTASPNVVVAIPASQQVQVTAPATFPTGVIAVRVYAGPTPGSESLQATLTHPSDAWTEPLGGLASGPAAPRTTTAEVGVRQTYPAGTLVTVHSDPAALSTVVLQTGDSLYLPSGTTVADPLVTTRTDTAFINALGVDLAVDATGQLAFSGGRGQGGDLALVSGVANLVQALKFRLRTAVGTLPLQLGYGNRLVDSLGERYTPGFLTYARALASACVLAEPRVSGITALQVRLDPPDVTSGNLPQGALTVSMTLSIANGSALLTVPFTLRFAG